MHARTGLCAYMFLLHAFFLSRIIRRQHRYIHAKTYVHTYIRIYIHTFLLAVLFVKGDSKFTDLPKSGGPWMPSYDGWGLFGCAFINVFDAYVYFWYANKILECISITCDVCSGCAFIHVFTWVYALTYVCMYDMICKQDRSGVLKPRLYSFRYGKYLFILHLYICMYVRVCSPDALDASAWLSYSFFCRICIF
jgi:hypothetical protein